MYTVYMCMYSTYNHAGLSGQPESSRTEAALP